LSVGLDHRPLAEGGRPGPGSRPHLALVLPGDPRRLRRRPDRTGRAPRSGHRGARHLTPHAAHLRSRARHGDSSVDALYTEWGRRFFVKGGAAHDTILRATVDACGLDADLLEAADDEKWDSPIVESMEIAYAFAGPKTQTPTIVVRDEPAHGFKGPVMAPAPTSDAAVRLWDAIQVLSREPGFFEITRPRANPPRPPALD
jgi:hypothetical protein